MRIGKLDAYKATISLTPRGRLRIEETLTFEPYDKNPKHIYYRDLQTRRDAQKVWPGEIVTGGLKKDFRTGYRLAFQATSAPAKPITATINYEMERVYYKGEPGYWVFDLAFDSAKSASIDLNALPSGATAWLFDASMAGKIISTCAGNGKTCNLATAQKLNNPKLVVIGPVPSEPYAPGIVARFAEADVLARLHQNSTMQLTFTTRDAKDAWCMPIFNQFDTYVAKTEGAKSATFARYSIGAKLFAAQKTPAITADLRLTRLDALEASESIEFGIGALDISRCLGTFDSSAESALYTQYKNITLELPSDQKVLAEAYLCKDNWEYNSSCEVEKKLLSEFKQNGNKAELTLLEPVMQREMIVRVYTPTGYLQDTGALTLFGYQLRHYWKYGHKPGWLHLTFILLYLLLFVAAITLIVKLISRAKEKARVAKEQKQLQATETAALKEIMAKDPKFDLEAFRARGKAIATHIQHSWCAGDMRDCRRYLSQGVYNRFRLQLKIMREIEKRKNVMVDFEIRRFYVLAHNRSGDYDCLTVRMEAAARDIMVKVGRPDDDAQKAAAKAPLNAFVEFYSFMRKRDAQTEHSESFDTCSHCGTPFKGEGELNKCKSCGAIAGSGTFDWVLAEITQASEYRGGAKRKDLGEISSDRIEDRASFVFWRDLMTRLTQNRDYIVRDATETYLAGEIKSQSLYDIAVGAADLESYKANNSESIAKVRIKWSASALQNTKVRHRQTIVTLRAQKSETAAGFAEHSCVSCGAPLPETDSIECSYCHSPIQRKNADWLLESVETKVE